MEFSSPAMQLVGTHPRTPLCEDLVSQLTQIHIQAPSPTRSYAIEVTAIMPQSHPTSQSRMPWEWADGYDEEVFDVVNRMHTPTEDG